MMQHSPQTVAHVMHLQLQSQSQQLQIQSQPQPQPPQPTPQAAPLHPAVSKITAMALSPIQKLYEQAWFKTVNNVQQEVGKLHAELCAAAEGERRARGQVDELRRECVGLRAECEGLRGERERLLRREKERRAAGGEAEEMRREVERERAARVVAERKLIDAMDKLRAVSCFYF